MSFQRLLMLAAVPLFLALGVGLWGIATPEANAAPPERIEICHIPPGNGRNRHTIEVDPEAVGAHMNHGDHMGECYDDDDDDDN